MVYNDIITLILIGFFSGSLVGFLSIGGGIVIVPMLHILYPDIPIQDIVIISLHQIFFSSLTTYITHRSKQKNTKKNMYWLFLHFSSLVIAAYVLHLLSEGLISILFISFIMISLIIRILNILEIHVKPFNYYNETMTTTCATIGSLIGLGGSLLLYPTLRLSNQPYKKVLKECAFSSLTVGLLGVISHDLLFILDINHEFPWLMMIVVTMSSIITARIASLKTYSLNQTIIDNISFILSVVIIIVYCYYL